MAKSRRPATDRVIDLAEAASQRRTRGAERRTSRRYAYDAIVALALVTPDGQSVRTISMRAKDLSLTGMRVIGRQMIHPGTCGAVQLMRSDGSMAIIGVTVRHCRYAGRMEHETGLEFGPLPPDLPKSQFLDRAGRMILLHPALRRNRAGASNHG